MKPRRAESRALEVLAKAGVDAAPVPVERLAREAGARLSFEPFGEEMSGMLYREGDHAIIGVNSAQSQPRQRFTIAHELGHLLLHEGRPVFVDKSMVRVNLRDGDSSLGTYREEREANAFAAELLMPRHLIDQALTRLVAPDGSLNFDEAVLELSERFEVSSQAMEFRLVNLGFAVAR